MITSTSNKTISQTPRHTRNDWDFLPTMFSAMAGISIGLILGSYLGWL